MKKTQTKAKKGKPKSRSTALSGDLFEAALTPNAARISAGKEFHPNVWSVEQYEKVAALPLNHLQHDILAMVSRHSERSPRGRPAPRHPRTQGEVGAFLAAQLPGGKFLALVQGRPCTVTSENGHVHVGRLSRSRGSATGSVAQRR